MITIQALKAAVQLQVLRGSKRQLDLSRWRASRTVSSFM